jgi:hypothetical protein
MGERAARRLELGAEDLEQARAVGVVDRERRDAADVAPAHLARQHLALQAVGHGGAEDVVAVLQVGDRGIGRRRRDHDDAARDRDRARDRKHRARAQRADHGGDVLDVDQPAGGGDRGLRVGLVIGLDQLQALAVEDAAHGVDLRRGKPRCVAQHRRERREAAGEAEQHAELHVARLLRAHGGDAERHGRGASGDGGSRPQQMSA